MLSHTWSPLACTSLAHAFEPASLLLDSWLWPSSQPYHLPLDAGVWSAEGGSVALYFMPTLVFYTLHDWLGQLGSWHLPWSQPN